MAVNKNAMVIKLTDNSVKLCCNGNGCPVVTDLGNGLVEIKDDNGDKIVIKKEEALLVSDGVKTFDDKKLILG